MDSSGENTKTFQPILKNFQAPEQSQSLATSDQNRSTSPIGHALTLRDERPSVYLRNKSSRFRLPRISEATTDPTVLSKIESLVQNILNDLELGKPELCIPLGVKKRVSQSGFATQIENNTPASLNNVSFPGDLPHEAWRFSTAHVVEKVIQRTASMLIRSPAVVLRILELIHEALVAQVVISKRNIYYKDPALFKSQAVVDRYVDILAYTFGVQRAALNVTAVAKGLAIGSFKLRFKDGSTKQCDSDSDAMLVENVQDVSSIDVADVAWVLVVEKESTFRTLASGWLHNLSKAGNGIIVTAKGYPDISTRAFLRLLSASSYPPPSVYALVDFDPDGLAIMATYKYGSFNLSHENANLNIPSLRWLGIKAEDMALSASAPQSDQGRESQKMLSLSKRDRTKAVQLLRKETFTKEGAESMWRLALQMMLMLNMKAEMEFLSGRDGGLVKWTDERLVAEQAKLPRNRRRS
ncbi:MAG: hypothetical protein LQ342_002660 [Letrouitia transgressa]|nr:MAG: hypothetical protein LQ342_002660 [Letrouitia transgressa]